MKYLQTLFDHSLEREYRLYQINAKELSERLKKQYNLPPVMLQLFNSDTDLGRNIKDIKHLKASGHEVKEDNWHVRDIREMVSKIKKNEHVSPMVRKGIHFGYELMPIAISAKADIENPETPIELLDGFKRMFVMEDIPDIDVLVKVYDEIDDREWINAMIVYNSWKFASGEGANKWMDRGFQLGLYYRYRMLFVKMILPEWDMFRALNIYTTGRDLESFWREGATTRGTYETFWNNSVFYDDIKAVYEILNSKPVFQLKKKGKIEEYNTRDKKYQQRGLDRILEVFVSLLGEIRRFELKNGIMERNPFDRNILNNYLSEPDMQKQFVEVIQMAVDGHIMNRIRTHMREDIKKRMYEGMGYEYIPPEKKVYKHEPIDISQIKL